MLKKYTFNNGKLQAIKGGICSQHPPPFLLNDSQTSQHSLIPSLKKTKRNDHEDAQMAQFVLIFKGTPLLNLNKQPQHQLTIKSPAADVLSNSEVLKRGPGSNSSSSPLPASFCCINWEIKLSKWRFVPWTQFLQADFFLFLDSQIAYWVFFDAGMLFWLSRHFEFENPIHFPHLMHFFRKSLMKAKEASLSYCSV